MGGVGEFLNKAEDVIPATTVQPSGVITQFVKNLVHLKAGQNGLDEYGALDRALRQINILLGPNKNVVPQPRLQMAFYLGQVEVRTASSGQKFPGIVEEVEAKIEDGARHRVSIYEDMPLLQVPAAGADEEHRDLFVQFVLLSRGGIGIGNGASDGIAQIDVAFEQVAPRRRAGVLKIGHKNLRARIERVDDHLAVNGSRNF